MICACGHRCRVIDSRNTWEQEEEKLRRSRYECQDCHRRFSTIEVEEETFDDYKKRAINEEVELYTMRKELKKLLE